jgi:GNAT superfamily N-acetyltransferase
MRRIADAGPLDAPELVALDHLARASLIETAIAERRCRLLRLEDGTCAGFAVIGPSLLGEAFLALLYIAKDARRRGHGRQLLRDAVARHRGRKLFTSTNQTNGAMQMLLAHEGFVPSGRVENLDAGDPELIYCRLP